MAASHRRNSLRACAGGGSGLRNELIHSKAALAGGAISSSIGRRRQRMDR